jgi:hypothetical protein
MGAAMSATTRAAGWLLNQLPPWCAAWAPDAVLLEAVEQLRRREARAVGTNRAALVMGEARELLAQLEHRP